MKRILILLSQIALIGIGISAFIFMLYEPHLEGRNVHATFFEVYFNDPFLLCAYIASIPFFVMLYQKFLLLGYIRHNTLFSVAGMKATRIIRYCATALVGFAVVGEMYLFIFQRGKDDIAGGVFMGLLIIFFFGVTSIVATYFEKTITTKSRLDSNTP